MTVKIGINGFGRIGRLAFRRILELGDKSNDIEVVAINDLTSPALLAHLLKYDSTHGTLQADVSATDDSIVVNGKNYRVYAEPDASKLPWVKNDGVDFVLECTGFYTSAEKSQAHLDAGAKRVLISAPAGKIKTIVYGVNDDQLNSDDRIVSAGSCTTNCLAPMVNAIDKEFGIKVGTMTTIHAFTSTQMILDGPVRGGNKRGARTASNNTIPHSEDQVNEAIHKYANENNDSFGWNADEIVSSDIINDTHGSVFDPTQTEVTTSPDGSQLVKTVAWYDNEYGFTCQMVRTLLKFATL